MVVLAIVSRLPLAAVKQVVNAAPGMWAWWATGAGGLSNRSMRRRPEHSGGKSWRLSQWDESVLGKRKCQRGARARKGGQSWVLTGAHVCEITGRTLEAAWTPVPDRTGSALGEIMWERVSEEGGIRTDGGAACPGATPNVRRRRVNHRANFKDPITGARKNNVEGMRGVMKNECRRQFARFPRRSDRASNGGASQYLGLVAWRANIRLKANRGGRKPGCLARFLPDSKALWEERREEVSVTTEGTGEPLEAPPSRCFRRGGTCDLCVGRATSPAASCPGCGGSCAFCQMFGNSGSRGGSGGVTGGEGTGRKSGVIDRKGQGPVGGTGGRGDVAIDSNVERARARVCGRGCFR